MDKLLYDWIAHHAAFRPDEIALIETRSGRQVGFAAFDRRIDGLARALREDLAVAAGDRVAMIARNCIDLLEAQFACWRLGAVFLPLNWRLTLHELSFIVEDAGPVCLIADRHFLEKAQALRVDGQALPMLETAADGSDSPYEAVIARPGLLEGGGARLESDVSTILYTSGTTGNPKGVLVTFGMTYHNAVNLLPAAAITPDSRLLCVLPYFHTAGLNLYSNPVLFAGGCVVIAPGFEAGETLTRLRDPESGITHFFGVPAVYQAMSVLPDFRDCDFSHLMTCGIGGSVSPKPLLQAWAERGAPLQQCYGMTETGPAMAVLEKRHAGERLGAVGRPVMSVELRLKRPDGQIGGPGDFGEIQARGPNVTPGYWQRADATAEAFDEGWLRTGDAARLDEDGFFEIVDRWKDLYISGGENVSPAEVESAIHALPTVADVAVVGVPDETWGETGCAFVVPREDAKLGPDEILAHCRERLAPFKLPRDIVFVSEVPRNASGKILRRRLRETRT